MISAVPGLGQLLTDKENRDGLDVNGCTAGCHWCEIWMKPFWVDFANKTICHDTRNMPCSAPGVQSAAITTATGTSTTRAMVTHPRVPAADTMAHLGLAMAVPRSTFPKDERLNRFLSDAKRSALLDSHETPPDTFRAHTSRLLTLITEAQAAISLGKAAGARSFEVARSGHPSAGSGSGAGSGACGGASPREPEPPGPIMDWPIPVNCMIAKTSSDKASLIKDKTITFGALTRNEMALAIVARGLHEYFNWASYVAWSGAYGNKVKANPLLREVHDSLLYDLSTITDAIINGVPISSRLDPIWDSNVFFVLGALVFRKDDSGVSAFYRQERALRFDTLCSKKFGWKPAATDGASGAGSAQHDAAADDGGDQDAAPSNPRKRGRDGGQNPKNQQGNPKKIRKGGPQKQGGGNAQKRIQQLQKELREARAKGKGAGGKDDKDDD